MKKRWIALLLAAVLPIGVLAGCGSEDMPELSLDSITAPVAAHNEMEVRTALGNYTGISEAAPDSADGEMATVQFAGDASATTALYDGAVVGRGEGHSKKEAEQMAARAALERLE